MSFTGCWSYNSLFLGYVYDKFERFIPDSEITVWRQQPEGHQHDDTAPKTKTQS